MSSDSSIKPQQLLDRALIKSLSMSDFSPDQRMVEEAVGQNKQGGDCDRRAAVPFGASQFGRSGIPVPAGQFPRKPFP